MSLKSVELQFALHKNDEAGWKQNQLNQKPLHDQSMLADTASKAMHKERQTASAAEGTRQAAIRDGGEDRRRREGSAGNGKRNGSGKPADNSALRSEHPYKGRHIDFVL